MVKYNNGGESMKILISYDNMLPHTTGNYFTKAFSQIAEVHYAHPKQLWSLTEKYDLYIKIDDGLYFNKWNPELHPSAYYIIDSHIDCEKNWRKDMVRESDFDHIFTAQKNGGEQLGINALWVPLGCDSELHSPINIETPKKYDVCFIGNFHSEYAYNRMEYVERLFKVFPNFYYGNRYFNDMAQKFYESKIVFNHALNKDINMRYFEACCSGAFQLATYIPDNGLQELYTMGEHFGVYDTIDDMVETARYYLEHEDEREAIASKGLTHTLANHTYLHRAKKILEVINGNNNSAGVEAVGDRNVATAV